MGDFTDAAMLAFHYEATDAEREHARLVDEPGALAGWFDDGRIVATASVYSRDMSVPGGTVPCAAVTAVTVVPSHRRRGLLTGLMRRQLDDLRDAATRSPRCRRRRAGSTGASATASPRPTAVLLARRPRGRLAAGRTTVPRCASRLPAEHVDAMRPCTSGCAARGRDARPPGALVGRPPPRPPERAAGATARARCWPTAATRCTRSLRPRRPRGRRARSASASSLPRRRGRARLWSFLLDQDLTRTLSGPARRSTSR